MRYKKYFKTDFIAYGLVVLFVLVFAGLSLGRHYALKSYLNDLGTYDQIIWNTLNGDFFDNSSNMLGARNYLAAHFSPILLFFVPGYFLYPSPTWLLFFQALAVGVGAIPIYLLSREKLKNFWATLVVLSSYLLNPFLHNALLYDFHEVVLAVAPASWAFYFLHKKNNRMFVLSAIILAFCQEHLALLVLMMGVYAYFIQKRRQFGLLVSACALVYFFAVVAVFMPYFSPSGKLALLEGTAKYENRYGWLGSSLPEMIKNIFHYPDLISSVIFSQERLTYLFYLVFSVFSLALYAWPIFIIFPIILINLLSSNEMTFSIFFYHSAIAIPFVYFSAIFSFERWFSNEKFLRRLFLLVITFASLYSLYFFSLSGIANGRFSLYWPDAHARGIKEVKKIIPNDVSLSVQHNLGPHFSQRKEIYRFPLKKDEAQYIVLDETDPHRKAGNYFADFEYTLQMEVSEWKKNISELRVSSQYNLIYEKDGYLVFRKR